MKRDDDGKRVLRICDIRDLLDLEAISEKTNVMRVTNQTVAPNARAGRCELRTRRAHEPA